MSVPRFNIITVIALFFSLVVLSQQVPNYTPKTPHRVSFSRDIPQSTNDIVIPKNNMTTNEHQFAQFEKDRLEYTQREAEKQKIQTDLISKRNIQYAIPNLKNDVESQYYKKAFDKLNQMNPDNFSVKEANFIVENAYYNNLNKYEDYERAIRQSKDFIELAMKNGKQDFNNNLAKNLAIFQFMTDTLKVGDLEHKPFTYDFDDYKGKKNWSKMLVQKLIEKGSGQCNSIPRLFLILAEELKTESYLAFAPNHSYIMFQDLRKNWYNAELTNGAITTDAIMFNANYIKSEAIVNKAYATPQTKKQVMSHLYNDLAMGYIQKFGIDGFVKEMLDKSLNLNPNGITGNILRNNYLFAQIRYVANQLQVKNIRSLRQYPKAMETLQKLQNQDEKLRNIGFDPVPDEVYKRWLEQIKKAKKEQQKKHIQKFNNQIKINRNTLKN